MRPRVTIGIAVYNGAKYLDQAIQSVLAQTFTDFELIISDNASTDSTEDVCREYAARDPRVRYTRSARDLGPAENYNRCFRAARGEYFKWHAHDDVCLPTFLERCVATLDAAPGAVLCMPATTTLMSSSLGNTAMPFGSANQRLARVVFGRPRQ